jgi:hypothetical protein
MWDFIQNQIFGSIRLGYASTLLISGFILTLSYERRDHFWLRFSLSSLLYIVLAFFAPDYLLWNWFLTAVFFILFVYSALIICCYKGSGKDYLFAIAGSFAIQDIGSHVTSLLRKITPDYFWARWWVGEASYALVFILGYLFFIRKMKKGDRIRTDSWILLLFSVISLLIGTVLSELERLYHSSGNGLLAASSILIRIMSLVILFAEYWLGQEKYEKQIIEQLMSKEQEHYQFVKSNIDSINAKCHNLKYEIQAIQAENDTQSRDSSLSKLMNDVNIYDSIPKTKNPFLDSILTEKCLYCEKHQIKFTYIIQGDRLSFMKPIDLYTLFGNALDNALECVIKYADKEKRIMSLSVVQKGDLLKIHLENYCEDPIKFQGGLPSSSKPDRDNHGFGLKSIRFIAEEYGGNLTISQENSMFMLNILIPVKEGLVSQPA